MHRFWQTAGLILLLVGMAAWFPATAQAQFFHHCRPVPVVSYYYTPATTYYAPPVSYSYYSPTTTYYAPPATYSYYSPTTTYYAPPVYSYYPPVSTYYYSPALVTTSPSVSTMRMYRSYGLFRPRGLYTETYYSPGGGYYSSVYP